MWGKYKSNHWGNAKSRNIYGNSSWLLKYPYFIYHYYGQSITQRTIHNGLQKNTGSYSEYGYDQCRIKAHMARLWATLLTNDLWTTNCQTGYNYTDVSKLDKRTSLCTRIGRSCIPLQWRYYRIHCYYHMF